MSDYDSPKRKRQGSGNTALGIFLLLPFILVALFIQLRPAIRTFMMSLTDFRLIQEAEFVGFENYSHLFSDPTLVAALKYTFALIVMRIVVLAVVPVIIGLLVGIQGKVGRILNRFVLGVLAALISPIALVMLWRGYWGPLWGREPSPFYPLPETMMLASPTGAVINTILLDALITMAIAVVVGTMIYVAVLRGRESHQSHVMKVGLSVWVIGILVAVGSALHSFLIPFLLTRGGPGRSTMSMVLYSYQQGFQNLRLGLAAAQGVLTIIPVLIGVLIIWFLLTMFRIRLIRTTNGNQSKSSIISIVSLPLILLVFAVIIRLVLWGHGIAMANGGYARMAETVNWNGITSNLTMPILAIWLIQIPISYLAGAALGLLRPFNRNVTNALFLVCLLVAFLPSEALIFQWFTGAADAELLDTKLVLAIPWLVSGISLLVFKLYFDGVYDEVEAAREQPTNTILQRAIVSSLPLVLLMGVVCSFMCIQSLMWSLVAVRSTENHTPAVSLAMLTSGYATEIALLESAAVKFVSQFFLPFALAFGLLCGFGLERFALVGGSEDSSTPVSKADDSFIPTTGDNDSNFLDKI